MVFGRRPLVRDGEVRLDHCQIGEAVTFITGGELFSPFIKWKNSKVRPDLGFYCVQP
jgi:hypothetical protein